MFIVDFLQALYDYVLRVVNEYPQHATNPFESAWYLFLNGGWIFVVIFSIIAFEHLWVEWLEEKFEHKQKYITLVIEVPRLNEQSPLAVENIFSMAWGTLGFPSFIDKYVKGWTPNKMSFEIVSNEGHIHYYIRIREKHRDLIEAAIYSQYPLAEIQQVEDYMSSFPKSFPNAEYDLAAAEFVLGNKDNYPIKTWPFFEDKLIGEFKDPLAHVIEVMNKLGQGETLSFQINVSPVGSDWKKTSEVFIAKIAGIPLKDDKHHAPGLFSMFIAELGATVEMVIKTFLGSKGAPEAKKEEKVMKMAFTPLEKEALEGLSMKASKVGFKSKIRAVYIAKKGFGRGGARIGELGAALSGFSSQNLNDLRRHIPSGIKSDYAWQKQMWSYYLSFTFYRPAPIRTMLAYANFKHRAIGLAATPYILCTEELASLWHFPSALIKSPLLRKIDAKRAEPPSNVPFRDDILFPSQIKEAASHGVAPPEAHDDHEKTQEVPDNLPFA